MTFSEQFNKANKGNARVIKMMEEAIGKTPDFADLTKANLYLIKDYTLDNLAKNSAANYFAILKAFLRKYEGEQYLPCKEYRDILKTRKEAVMNTYLSKEDLHKLEKVRVRGKTEEYVKTIFLIQAFTGCRLSDAERLDRTNIKANELEYVAEKTGQGVRVPLKPLVKELIERKEGMTPVAKFTYNRLIRDLCQKAGIADKVKVFKAGQVKIGHKFEFVSSHTARRSFATNLFLISGDIFGISKLMGHTSTEMTMKYICVNTINTDKFKEYFN